MNHQQRSGDVERSIRVFISSTFRDMHAERDYLSRVVFPELRSRCLQRGIDFIGLDLRWGVTEEESQREGALAICLDEIERCRPFFVCLLGSRFGWVPPPEEVPQEVFDRIAAAEAVPAIVARSYLLDATSTPPVYRLRRGRDELIPNDVAHEIARYWETKGLPLAGESITSLEILRAVFEEGYPPSHALVYLRRPGLERDRDFPQRLLPFFAERDRATRTKLAWLKRRIRGKRREMVVRSYAARYAGLRIETSLLPQDLSDDDRRALRDGVITSSELAGLSETSRQAVEEHGAVTLSGMEQLGEQVLADLWAVIERELERPRERRDAHEQERAFHERFIRERTRIFLGRQDILDRIVAYAGEGADRQLLVVTGDPGSGKSALLAACAVRLRQERPRALVIPHFIGTSPGSTLLHATLRSLCETLRRECALQDEVPGDSEKLKTSLEEFLRKASAKREAIVILDAVNQLDPAGRSHELGWLPLTLTPGVKLIVSTLAGDCLDRLRLRVAADRIVDVPRLDPGDRQALVSHHLMLRRKRLSGGQLERLLDNRKRPDVGLPLYLLVAVEELTLFGEYEALDKRIDRLPPTLAELFQQVLARVEQDHGHEIAESVCRWMAVSRSGLLETEILDLLSGGADFPRARWTRFYRGLEFYMRPIGEEEGAKQTGLVDFYHDQLRVAAYRRYLGMAALESEPSDAYRDAQRELANYFRSASCDEGDPPRWHAARHRGLSELPYHQTRGERWQDLRATLTDLGFVEAKSAAMMAYDLVSDYQGALAAMTGTTAPDAIEEMTAFGRFVQGQAHTMSTHPHLIFQQAANQPDSSAVAIAARRRWRIGAERRSWLEWVNKPQEQGGDRCIVTLEGHSDGVNACAYSPDGRRLVSASHDGTLKIWDSVTGAIVATLTGHANWVVSCAYAPDGRRLVSGSWDGTLKIWDAATGALVATLAGHSGYVIACAYSPDGRRLVSASRDRTLKIWDAATGAEVAMLAGHADTVVRCAYAPAGRRLVSACLDGTLKIWDAATGAEVATLAGHTAQVYACAYAPDGRRLVSASRDGTLKIWDAATGAEVATLAGHAAGVTACAYSPDGRRLVSASDDHTLKIWEAETGALVATLTGHSEGPRNRKGIPGDGVQACAYAPDGRRLVSASGDRTLKIWDAATGAEIATLAGHAGPVVACAYAPDGRRLVSASDDHTLKIWDAETGTPDATPAGHSARVNACAYAPDGRRLVSASGDRTVKIWDAATGAEIATLAGHAGPVVACACAPDGRRLVSASGDDTLKIWDSATGALVATLAGHSGGGRACAYAPDGRRLVSASGDRTVKIWDAATGAAIATLAGHAGPVVACAYAPDGRRLVSASGDDTLKIWDTATGALVATLAGHYGGVTACAYAPDGRRLVSAGGGDRTLKIWDAATGAKVATLAGHSAYVGACAYAPDGRRLVSACFDRTLKIWDAATGALVATLAGHAAGVTACAYSPDGRRLVSASVDGTLRTWDAVKDAEVNRFSIGLKVTSLALGQSGEAVALGDELGHVYLLRRMAVDSTIPATMIVYLYDFDRHAWHTTPSARCEWCGHRFSPQDAVLDILHEIAARNSLGPDDSPCIALAAEVWNDPRLVSECPSCGKPLKFNPFIVDNRRL